MFVSETKTNPFWIFEIAMTRQNVVVTYECTCTYVYILSDEGIGRECKNVGL